LKKVKAQIVTAGGVTACEKWSFFFSRELAQLPAMWRFSAWKMKVEVHSLALSPFTAVRVLDEAIGGVVQRTLWFLQLTKGIFSQTSDPLHSVDVFFCIGKGNSWRFARPLFTEGVTVYSFYERNPI